MDERIWPIALLLLFFAAFRRADPGNVTGFAADTVAECEQPEGANVALLERCLAAQPDDVELMLDLGAAYESAGRWPDAERVYSRAVRVDPRDGQSHLRLGRAHLALGDVAAARQDGEAALVTLPGDPEVLRLVEADAGKAGP